MQFKIIYRNLIKLLGFIVQLRTKDIHLKKVFAFNRHVGMPFAAYQREFIYGNTMPVFNAHKLKYYPSYILIDSDNCNIFFKSTS